MLKFVILDLDGTLYDSKKIRQNTYAKIENYLNANNVDCNVFWEKYKLIEPRMFNDFLEKKISGDEYIRLRYRNSLEGSCENQDLVCEELEKIYFDDIAKSIELYEDAAALLRYLKELNLQICILTNGSVKSQTIKYQSLRLQTFISDIFISEEIGYHKPEPEAFEYVLRCFGAEPENAIMIGDSIKYDILGAQQVGIKAVLVDRDGKYSEYNGLKINSMDKLMELI